MLPIVHIDQLAEYLSIERRWILDHWLKHDPPAPHFRDGHHVFFDLEELHQWARRRSYGSDCTDMPADPSD